MQENFVKNIQKNVGNFLKIHENVKNYCKIGEKEI